jgi:hypothetical protein
MKSWINLFKLWDKLTFSRKKCPLFLFPSKKYFWQNLWQNVKLDKIYTRLVEGLYYKVSMREHELCILDRVFSGTCGFIGIVTRSKLFSIIPNYQIHTKYP